MSREVVSRHCFARGLGVVSSAFSRFVVLRSEWLTIAPRSPVLAETHK